MKTMKARASSSATPAATPPNLSTVGTREMWPWFLTVMVRGSWSLEICELTKFRSMTAWLYSVWAALIA